MVQNQFLIALNFKLNQNKLILITTLKFYNILKTSIIAEACVLIRIIIFFPIFLEGLPPLKNLVHNKLYQIQSQIYKLALF